MSVNIKTWEQTILNSANENHKFVNIIVNMNYNENFLEEILNNNPVGFYIPRYYSNKNIIQFICSWTLNGNKPNVEREKLRQYPLYICEYPKEFSDSKPNTKIKGKLNFWAHIC